MTGLAVKRKLYRKLLFACIGLHKALKRTADITYNMVSVDGDTSTNDTLQRSLQQLL